MIAVPFCSFRLELSSFGVKVCIIEPGYFKTAVTDGKNFKESFNSIWERLPGEIRQAYGESYFQGSKCHLLMS